MRQFEKFGLQLQYDTNSLLDQKYDDAIIGIDYTSTKFVYDINRLQKILKQNNKVDDNEISNIMDKQFFMRENKPVYLEKIDKNDVNGYLKIISLLKRTKQ